MFNSVRELLDKIRLGEDSFLELKEVRFAGDRVSAPERRALADELAAFANSRGGICVLGVEDATREIVGIPSERLDAVENFVREACSDSIDPPLTVVIERLSLPSTTGQELPVMRIEVPRSLFVHRSPGGFLHRVGSSKRPMEAEYLARLFQQRSQTRLIRFDEQVVADASLEDLDPALVARFRTPRSRDEPETLLRKLGMAREDERGDLRPSVAGVLLAALEPHRWLPNAFIQAVAYRGESIAGEADGRAYQIDAKDLTGPLDAQVADACRFVLRNQKVAASKKVGRRDLPQYDITAVFEAVVNAVAHRDYSMYGAKVRLRLFANRLELYSPGALPNTMTVDSLPYRQSSRNETVTSLLAKCSVPDVTGLDTQRSTLMDRRGEGVTIILERSEQLSGKRPSYDLIDEAELRLTVYAATLDSEPSHLAD